MRRDAIRAREPVPPAVLRPPENGVCIVMVCTDLAEADQVSRQLAELNSGCLVTYRRVEDLTFNAPAGRVALMILATGDGPNAMARTLRWLHHRWPRCPVAVVGDAGCGEHEMVAREGGAFYLTRPVAPDQWGAILSHVLGGQRQVADEGYRLKDGPPRRPR